MKTEIYIEMVGLGLKNMIDEPKEMAEWVKSLLSSDS